MGMRHLRLAACAILLAAPGATLASSSAETGACLESTATVRACSTKELSNVLVQCSDESGSYFVKYDELDDGDFEGLVTPYEGVFSCPEGDVIAVFVKSGRNGYDGPAIDGLPPGTGAAWSPQSCATTDSGCAPEEDEGGGEEGGEENVDGAE
jgi:hypothetical protein